MDNKSFSPYYHVQLKQDQILFCQHNIFTTGCLLKRVLATRRYQTYFLCFLFHLRHSRREGEFDVGVLRENRGAIITHNFLVCETMKHPTHPQQIFYYRSLVERVTIPLVGSSPSLCLYLSLSVSLSFSFFLSSRHASFSLGLQLCLHF